MAKKKRITAGAPTKYKAEYCQRVIDKMATGVSLAAFANEIDVTRDTCYEWARTHQEFSDALKKAQTKCLEYWEGRAQKGANGEIPGFNSTMAIFMMKSRFRDDYADIQTVKQETTHVIRHADIMQILSED